MYICNCAGITEEQAKHMLILHTIDEMINLVPCINPRSCGRCLTEFKEIRKQIIDVEKQKIEEGST